MEEALSLGSLVAEPTLLAFEQVKRDGVRVVRLEELGFFSIEAFETLSLGSEVGLMLSRGKLDEIADVGSDALQLLAWESDVRPQSGHLLLDEFYRQVRQGAAVLAGPVPAEAEEVGVHRPVSAATAGEAQSAPAAPAGEHALEVVGALDGLLVGVVPTVEHGLDVLEQLERDEWSVSPTVLAAVVGHDADVIWVPKHLVDTGPAERLLGVALGRSGGETAVGQLRGHLRYRPLAGRECRECPAHQWCSVVVDGDRADLAAFDLGPRVAVADRREPDGATESGLLFEALLRLGRKVRAVELGDGGHDAVEELAAGSLVDVLGCGDDLGAGAANVHDDADVVLARAGEPVDLVDDDVVDVAGQAEPLQHRLELRSGSGAGGLASVEVLVDDGGTELFGLAVAGIALGRDGEPFVAEVGLGLLSGGYAQVDDSACGARRRNETARGGLVRWFGSLGSHWRSSGLGGGFGPSYGDRFGGPQPGWAAEG